MCVFIPILALYHFLHLGHCSFGFGSEFTVLSCWAFFDALVKSATFFGLYKLTEPSLSIRIHFWTRLLWYLGVFAFFVLNLKFELVLSTVLYFLDTALLGSERSFDTFLMHMLSMRSLVSLMLYFLRASVGFMSIIYAGFVFGER